jgi:hypothetical protein
MATYHVLTIVLMPIVEDVAMDRVDGADVRLMMVCGMGYRV